MESALIDGATRWQLFGDVALPIAQNNFVFGIVLAGASDPHPAGCRLHHDLAELGTAAAALIVTLPVLLLTVIAQRQIVAGLTAGAVKGG